MPKRTNPFQQLADAIIRSFAPWGEARVTESAEYSESQLEGLREVDVHVAPKDNPQQFQLKVAVEAKDHKRPLDVNVVEALIGKYLYTPGRIASKVVLVARNGFTANARIKASKVGIELMTLHEVSTHDWKALVPYRRHQMMSWPIPPHIDKVEIDPRPPIDPKSLNDGQLICVCCGEEYGSPMQFARRMLPRLLGDSGFHQAAFKGFTRAPQLILRGEIPAQTIRFDFGGNVYPVDKIIVFVHLGRQDMHMTSTPYALNRDNGTDLKVQHIVGKAGQATVEIIVPEEPTKGRLIFRVRSNTPQPPQ